MTEIIDYAKKHPLTVAALGLVGIVLLYMLTRSRQAAASPQTGLIQATLAEQQLQAQSNAASGQVNAQLAAAQLSAQVQQAQVNGAVSTQNTAQYAALIAALAQNNTTARANEISGEVTNNQVQTEAQILAAHDNASLLALSNTNDTQLQAYLAQLHADTQIQQAQINAATSVIPNLQHLGIGENYNSEIIGLLGEAFGQPGVAQAGIVAPASVLNSNAAASASKFNAVLASINNIASAGLAAL